MANTVPSKLNLAFTISVVVNNVAALPIGIILDNIGPKKSSIIGCILFLLGNFIMGLKEETMGWCTIPFLFLRTNKAHHSLLLRIRFRTIPTCVHIPCNRWTYDLPVFFPFMQRFPKGKLRSCKTRNRTLMLIHVLCHFGTT